MNKLTREGIGSLIADLLIARRVTHEVGSIMRCGGTLEVDTPTGTRFKITVEEVTT